jgi:hypothetical protein
MRSPRQNRAGATPRLALAPLLAQAPVPRGAPLSVLEQALEALVERVVAVVVALVVVVAVPASARVTKRERAPRGYLSPPPGVFAGVRRLA